MLRIVKKIVEVFIDGSGVRIEKHGDDDYTAHVSYNSYNTKGAHIASPTWSNRGNVSETKEFIQREVRRASDHNKP